MNMETIIIWLIGLGAAAYLLRLLFKVFSGKTGCSCSNSNSECKQCPLEGSNLKEK